MVGIDLQGSRKPMIHYTIEGIVNGIDKKLLFSLAILTANHVESDPNAVENYVDSYLETTEIAYKVVREPRPLGTAGAIYNALGSVDSGDAVIVCPGDVLYPYSNLNDLAKTHYDAGAKITWAVTSRPGKGAQNAGRLWTDVNTSQLIRSYETTTEPFGSKVPENVRLMTSVGVVVIDPDYYLRTYHFFREENLHETPDIYRMYIPWVLSKGEKVLTYDILKPAPDLGTPERLKQFGRKRTVATVY
jgi:NDP-sugar pyrophosphorylase family protein